jgi:hypothetical protein
VRTINTTLSAAGNSPALPLDYRVSPFEVTIETYLTGAANFTIQYTTDDLLLGAPTNWINATGGTAVSANTEVTLISPVTAVRLVYNSGSGSVTMAVLQAG